MRTYRKALYTAPQISTEESFVTKTLLQIIIHGPFFGIPQTYLAHIKKASEFRGHLAGLRQSWESYTRQLVQEYSDFILIVSIGDLCNSADSLMEYPGNCAALVSPVDASSV